MVVLITNCPTGFAYPIGRNLSFLGTLIPPVLG